MNESIRIDWNKFSSKFSGDEERNFEWLSYVLFCLEYDRPWGIFGYYNQVGIETEPIKVGNEYIGFQSKYYTSSAPLSTKKNEFKKMIIDAKRRNPDLNKIIVYTNKQFRESSNPNQKKPNYLKEIESTAHQNNVVVEWKVKSQIEGTLLSEKIPSNVLDYFFNTSSGIREFERQVKLHTNNILDSISKHVAYNKKIVHFKRVFPQLAEFLQSSTDCLVIYGQSGTGKSGIIKDFYEDHFSVESKCDVPIYIFRATDFEADSIYEFSRKFGYANFSDFFSAFNNIKSKVIVIDGAEKALTHLKCIIGSFISAATKLDWKVILTIRSTYLNNFLSYVIEQQSYELLELSDVTWDSVEHELNRVGCPPPEDSKLQKLICNLFYLNLYMQTFQTDSEQDTKISFYNRIWEYKIKGMYKHRTSQMAMREQFVVSMVTSILDNNTYYYAIEEVYSSNRETTAELLEDDCIIKYDDTFKGYYFYHDVFEEIVARAIIKQYYLTSSSLPDFFTKLTISMPMRKYYRNWLIEEGFEHISARLSIIFSSRNINKIWADETLLSILSDYKATDDIKTIMDLLYINNFEMLYKAIFLLNTSCKILNNDLPSQLKIDVIDNNYYLYYITKPIGQGWELVIDFIHNNIENILAARVPYKLIIGLLKSWVRSYKNGNTTKSAGLIALYILNRAKEYNSIYFYGKLNEDLMSVISESSLEIRSELTEIISKFRASNSINRQTRHFELCEFITSNILNSSIPSQSIPIDLLRLCEKLWLFEGNTPNAYEFMYIDSESIEIIFGLNSTISYDLYPVSAYKTPIYALLKTEPHETISFIINFINKISSHYSAQISKKSNKECYKSSIECIDGQSIEQICSIDLWGLHRGMGNGPKLLQCTLMALEKWCLEYLDDLTSLEANDLCIKMLKNSNNVAITSMIVSLVLCYPFKLFKTACCLSTMNDLFSLDISRYVWEQSSNIVVSGLASNMLYDNERRKENEKAFRKKKFENILVDYQIHFFNNGGTENRVLLSELYTYLDKLYERASPNDIDLRFALNRIDLRKLKPDASSKITDESGDSYIELTVQEDPDLSEIRRNNDNHNKSTSRLIRLSLWARARIDGRSDVYSSPDYTEFETNPSFVVNELYELISAYNESEETSLIMFDTKTIVSAVLVRDFNTCLLEKELGFCSRILVEDLLKLLSADSQFVPLLNSNIFSAVPFLFSFYETNSYLKKRLYLFHVAVVLLNNTNRFDLLKCFSSDMWKNHENDANIIVAILITVAECIENSYGNISISDALNKALSKKRVKINSIIRNADDMNISLPNLNINHQIIVLFLININNTNHFSLFLPYIENTISVIFSYSTGDIRQSEFDYYLAPEYIKWITNYVYFSCEDRVRILGVNSKR